jgi:hypothetical protein
MPSNRNFILTLFLNIICTASLDLASNYDQNTGNLAQDDFTLAQISAISNVKDGYAISAAPTNNFQLENTEGAGIDYTLRFDGATTTPSTAVLTTATANGEALMTTGATSSFADNILGDADLVLQNAASTGFIIQSENFSDTITLTITAN